MGCWRTNDARSFLSQAKDDFLIGREGGSSQMHGPARCDAAAHSSFRRGLLDFLYSMVRNVPARRLRAPTLYHMPYASDERRGGQECKM